MGKLWASALTTLTLLAFPAAQTADIPTPEAHFGFEMGAERQIAPADAIEAYFELIAKQSDRVKIEDLGRTTEGHRTIAAVISSPENIRNLEAIRRTNAELADPRTLSPEDARGKAATQKAVLVIGCSIHSIEIGATQAANDLIYSLATSADPSTLEILDNVVIIVIPLLNPDGHRLVTDWYQQTRGTPYEGRLMPWLYHKYAGHDINRDGFMMNLAESRNLAKFFYSEWHPHVFLTMHEMLSNGPRIFVPPNDDPIDPNYDPLVWREAALLGGAMAFELERTGHTGVLSNGLYDYYWPGYEDSAPLGHNTVCLLTEVAQVAIASAVSVSPSELRAGVRGLPEYRQKVNFPNPWPGGRWTLHDIVDYDLTAVNGLLRAVAAYRGEIVQGFYDMGRRAVESGRRGGPYAFIIPPEQHDPFAKARLEELLLRGEIEIHRALEPFRADGDPYPAGTDVILLSQPYRAYVKTLLERQNYPATRRSDTGVPEQPYDVVGWSLPFQMGVSVTTIDRSFQPPAMSRITEASVAEANVWGDTRPSYYLIDARGNAGAIAINRLVAAGVMTSWTSQKIDAGGFRYDPGSIVVPYTKESEPVVRRIASGLGLRADGLKGKMPAALSPVGKARIGLYKPWIDNIDEGWTRWLLEQYEFSFASIPDAEMRAGGLRAKYDVIILPSAPADQIVSGNPRESVPPQYAGGLGPEGSAALREFANAGGTVVAMDEASRFVIDAFRLPLRDVAHEPGTKLFCPGSILRLTVDPAGRLGYGMSPQTAAFFASSFAFESTGPGAGGGAGDGFGTAAVQTIARYGERDLLLSGLLEGEEVIAGRPAMVEATVGAGRAVLIGFPAQHRGQSHATFRLLFNSLLAAN